MLPRVGYASDLTDGQWKLVERELCGPGKRGRAFGPDIRQVVDGMLYVSHTGCQWRYLPAEFGKWTRVWSQFRRWSRNGTWSRLLAALHQEARTHAGRAEALPSLLVIDTHLARGAAHGGPAFHDQGGPYGRTLGAKRVVAVDATGLPVAALVVPASTHENDANTALLEHLAELGVSDRLAVVMVDRGMTRKAAQAAANKHGVEVRVTGWPEKSSPFRPIAHAWRVEVAHGRLGRSRRLAKSFEKTVASASGWLQVACVAAVLDDLTRKSAQPGKQASKVRKNFTGPPAWTVVTAA
jgi:putative transposase